MIERHLPQERGVAILHWFTGSRSEARRAAALGCYFSVNRQMMESRSRSSAGRGTANRSTTFGNRRPFYSNRWPSRRTSQFTCRRRRSRSHSEYLNGRYDQRNSNEPPNTDRPPSRPKVTGLPRIFALKTLCQNQPQRQAHDLEGAACPRRASLSYSFGQIVWRPQEARAAFRERIDGPLPSKPPPPSR